MKTNIMERQVGKTYYSYINGRILIRGIVEQAEPREFLVPFFKHILDNPVEGLTMDVIDLELMNSSGITCLAQFICGLKDIEHPVTIRIDMKKPWQKTSLRLISSLSSYVTIED